MLCLMIGERISIRFEKPRKRAISTAVMSLKGSSLSSAHIVLRVPRGIVSSSEDLEHFFTYSRHQAPTSFRQPFLEHRSIRLDGEESTRICSWLQLGVLLHS